MADIFVNIGGSYKELDKAYVNISGTWKEIEKIWVNIGGTWKQVDVSAFPQYSKTLANLYATGGADTGINVGNYALYAGGASGPYDVSAATTAYNMDLVRSRPTDLSVARIRTASARAGNFAVFAGGSTSLYVGHNTAATDAYDATLTRITTPELPTAVQNIGAGSIGNYAVFAGGRISGTVDRFINTVTTYNGSLVRGTASNLTQPEKDGRSHTMGARVGNYLLFAGGYGIQGSPYGDGYYTFDLVDAYNTSLVKTTATVLSAPVRHGGKYGHGNTWYAIFSVGGEATLNLYNASLVRTTLVTTANKAPVGMATFENFTVMVAANTNTVEVLDNLTLLKFPGDSLPADTAADSCVTLGTTILVAGNNVVYALT